MSVIKINRNLAHCYDQILSPIIIGIADNFKIVIGDKNYWTDNANPSSGSFQSESVNKNLLSWDIWVLEIKVHGDFGFRN